MMFRRWLFGCGLVVAVACPLTGQLRAGQLVLDESFRRATDGIRSGAVFGDISVWTGQQACLCRPPDAPAITAPANNETLSTCLAFVQWTGESHSQYQIRVGTADDPDGPVVWDSFKVRSDRNYAWTGRLSDRASYFVFVRLANGHVWGAWSAGRSFRLDKSSIRPGPDSVEIRGSSLIQNSGPFLGLGATYMSALRFCRDDRRRFLSDLAFLASQEFTYIRILSMVSWRGMEILPSWPDYDQQLRDLLDLTYRHGMRTEITIFADAQIGMPDKAARRAHLDRLLSIIRTPDPDNPAGREHKVMHLEVANEAWQNGFPGEQGIAELRAYGRYLAARTAIPVALSSASDTTDAGIAHMYGDSAADLATVHFSRDCRVNGGWEPVYDSYRTGLAGVPPMSSNEPIGPGSSVCSDTDPIRLVMGAAFAWTANLPAYVFHSQAGIQGIQRFEQQPAVGSYVHLNDILPGDLASWIRNDGKEVGAPFTTYCSGQANKYWPEVAGATTGVVRHTGATKGDEFVTLPIGILGGGVELEARRPMLFQAYHPLTGASVVSRALDPGTRFMLGQGPRAYVIRGAFTDHKPVSEVSVDLGNPDVSAFMDLVSSDDGMTGPVTINGRDCRQNVDLTKDFYFYFAVGDGFAFQGNRPDVYITLEYLDGGSGTISLQYDSDMGSDRPAFYRHGGDVVLTGDPAAPAWKRATFHLADAYFGNRQNANADFRFAGFGHRFYIDSVRVAIQPP